mgnify:CR=1 FL=1
MNRVLCLIACLAFAMPLAAKDTGKAGAIQRISYAG